MTPILKIAACIFLLWVMIFISCKKEHSCENCSGKNQQPIANAGNDAIIILPVDSAMLDGTASTDPDNNINDYEWKKIIGPSSSNIYKHTAIKTEVNQLSKGVYQFELKVTDKGGLFSKDTVQVIVNNPITPSKPPVANAGADQTITLPTNTVDLDGSGSTDPDNNITGYLWTKISGPSSFSITHANVVQTQVANLVQGDYQFELRVTDIAGSFSMDTIQVTVLPIVTSSNNGILIPFGTLSIARAGIASSTAGNKVLFAGGFTTCGTMGSGICHWYSRVDIYDMNTQTWSTTELSEARTDMGVASLGNKIFFAGGYTSSDDATSRVDIYDATTNTWSTAELSEARVSPAAASAGTKIFFGGGCPLNGGLCETPSSRVDFYDATTNTWSATELSEARSFLAATSVGNKVLFAGGWGNNAISAISKRLDSYNTITNQWSIDSISGARAGLVAATLNTKAFFGGGVISFGNTPVSSNRVDVYNNATETWTIAYLNQSAEFAGAASDGTRVLFFPYGIRMEIYNSVSNTWYFSDLTQQLYSSSVIGAGGQIYVAGGALNSSYTNYTSQVWQVQF